MTDLTVTIAGETFPVKPMTDGQVESLFRIQRSLSAAGDSSVNFYGKQLARMGELIDGVLTSEEDVDRLDRLFLAGKASSREVLSLLFAAYQAGANEPAPIPTPAKKAVAVTKKTPAKKAPAKKAVRGAK